MSINIEATFRGNLRIIVYLVIIITTNTGHTMSRNINATF